jgi:hypothetical protein
MLPDGAVVVAASFFVLGYLTCWVISELRRWWDGRA